MSKRHTVYVDSALADRHGSILLVNLISHKAKKEVAKAISFIFMLCSR